MITDRVLLHFAATNQKLFEPLIDCQKRTSACVCCVVLMINEQWLSIRLTKPSIPQIHRLARGFVIRSLRVCLCERFGELLWDEKRIQQMCRKRNSPKTRRRLRVSEMAKDVLVRALGTSLYVSVCVCVCVCEGGWVVFSHSHRTNVFLG